VEDRQNKPLDDLLDHATDALRRVRIPAGPPPELVAQAVEAGFEVEVIPISSWQSTSKFNRIARVAVAATIFVALGFLASWITSGRSSNISFAAVVAVVEHLRSATFDMNVVMKGDSNVTMKAKGSFLAPSGQRIEGASKALRHGDMVLIADYDAAKCIVLMPKQKMAIVVDSEKIKEQINNPMTCMFETMRCFVREGRSRSGQSVATIGKKEIDGKTAVGFVAQSSMGEMVLWADPETARPVRIELDMPAMKTHGVLSNFEYDVDLDPSLFSLEPPQGYLVQTMNVASPLEKGLIETLRAVAQQRNGDFPAKLGMNREVMDALQAIAKPDIGKIATTPDKRSPDAVMATLPLEQKHMQGILFYLSLKPENDAHYTGRGVKLGTSDRAIFWYKPAGTQNYRVIFGDLTVKEMSPNEVKTLSGTNSK
jgi:outer membrane lipoprotein-sorting protein